MKVVLYLRYSSEKQNEQSIEGQRRICMQYCKNNNMTVINSYEDRALSASKNTDRRENFQRMIKDSERNIFDAVIVYKLDRFSRNRYDSAIYKNKLKKNGVRVISATENITENPEGIILESVLEGMAEFYSAELAQKVTRGMHETALKCNSCGGSIPLGYKIENKKFVIDTKTAPIVQEAFQRYANGETINDIARSFNQRGYKTSKGVEFNKNSFKRMFQNERYIGIYKYKDIRIENGIPQIIDKELFDTVHNRLKINAQAPARAKAKEKYLLSQKLFCGHCGAFMIGESGTSKNGERHFYYKCSNAKHHHTCNKKAIRKDLIERAVIEDIIQLLTPQNIEIIADMAVKQIEKDLEENTTIPTLEENLKETEKSINNLIKLVERGSTSETLLNRLDELEENKKDLIKRIEEEKQQFVILDKPQIIWWLNKFTKGDINDEYFCQQLIDIFVNSVTVWDEPDGYYKITTIYNLSSEKTKTIKCSDLTRNGSPKKPHTNRCVAFLLSHQAPRTLAAKAAVECNNFSKTKSCCQVKIYPR